MAGFAQLFPFALVAVLACLSIGITLRNALPAIVALRRERAQCPATREVRFVVRELRYVSRVNVIDLPVRSRTLLPGQRAAA